MTSIADQIRTLKPGDRVKVTREQTIPPLHDVGSDLVPMVHGPNVFAKDPTITSIQVISKPLAVDDRVVIPGVIRGSVRAIADERAMVLWDDGSYGLAVISDLCRVAP